MPPGQHEVRVDVVPEGGSRRQLGLVRRVDVGTGETRCDIDLDLTLPEAVEGRGESGER